MFLREHYILIAMRNGNRARRTLQEVIDSIPPAPLTSWKDMRKWLFRNFSVNASLRSEAEALAMD